MFFPPTLLFYGRSGLRPSLVQGLRPRNAPLQNHRSPTLCAHSSRAAPAAWLASSVSTPTCRLRPLTPAVPLQFSAPQQRPPPKPSLTDHVPSSQRVGWRAWPRLYTSCVTKSPNGSKDDWLVNYCGLVATTQMARTLAGPRPGVTLQMWQGARQRSRLPIPASPRRLWRR